MHDPLCHDVLTALVASLEVEIKRIDDNAIRMGRKPDARREEVRAALHDASMALTRLDRVRNRTTIPTT